MIFRRRKDKRDIRLKYVRLLYDLKHLQSRVKIYITRLEGRIKQLEVKIRRLKDKEAVREYVKLLNLYKSLINKLRTVDTSLEHLMIRIETLTLLDSISLQIGMIKLLLSRVRSYVKGLPDIELIVEDLIERANELISDFGNIKDDLNLNVKIENEVKKILETASVAAEKRNEI
ncbi:MAG: hypothetical protein B6U85_00660 [Desulfurococcales archaeon ex4484_42]|nr:MAG: hypothetical protein B6U85_00660 [Desulfurococcales archaeon ex4484_42]